MTKKVEFVSALFAMDVNGQRWTVRFTDQLVTVEDEHGKQWFYNIDPCRFNLPTKSSADRFIRCCIAGDLKGGK